MVVLSARGALEVRFLRAAHDKANSGLTACSLGAALLMLEQYEEAKEVMAAHRDAGIAEPYANLAVTELHMGNLEATDRDLSEALGPVSTRATRAFSPCSRCCRRSERRRKRPRNRRLRFVLGTSRAPGDLPWAGPVV